MLHTVQPRPLYMPPGLIVPHNPAITAAPMTGGMSVMSGMGQDFPGYGSGGGGGGDGSLSDIVASSVFDLDVTISASYPGTGQTWYNLCTAPADGSAQSAYDFVNGATSSSEASDATFTGTAGDPAAYWLYASEDRQTIASNANTTFTNNLSKSTGGTDFWIAIAFRLASTSGTRQITGTFGASTFRGINISTNGTDIRCTQRQSANAHLVFGTVAATTDYVAIYTRQASSGSYRAWLNDRTGTSGTHTFNSGTNNPDGVPRVGGLPFAAGVLNNNDRVYAVAYGNGYIDSTAAGLIFDEYNSRHGRTYV